MAGGTKRPQGRVAAKEGTREERNERAGQRFLAWYLSMELAAGDPYPSTGSIYFNIFIPGNHDTISVELPRCNKCKRPNDCKCVRNQVAHDHMSAECELHI